jgi:hypothetical protein
MVAIVAFSQRSGTFSSEEQLSIVHRRVAVPHVDALSNVGVGAVGRPHLPSLSSAAAALSSMRNRGGRLLSCGAPSTTRR